MAYARITFTTSTPSAGLVLRTIARVLTGESNIANLSSVGNFFTSTAGVATSEIVGDTAADSWTLVYPSSLPTDNQLPTFTVRAPCLTSGKDKFVRFIGATNAGVFTEPIYSGGTVFSSTTNYTIYAQGLSSIDGSGNCANLTWRNNNGTQATVIKGTSTLELFQLEMSWSKRHLFITSSLGNNCYFAAVEFPETALTSAYSTAVPVLYMTGPATSTLSSLTANSTAAAHVHNLVNMYNPVTTTTVGVRALTPTSLHTARIQSSVLYTIRTFLIREDTAINGPFNITPIVHDDIGFGNGYLDLSVLSSMYIGPNDVSTNGNTFISSTGVNYKGISVFDAARASSTMFMVRYG